MEEAKIVEELAYACKQVGGEWSNVFDSCKLGETTVRLTRSLREGVDIEITSNYISVATIKGITHSPFRVSNRNLRIELFGEDFDCIFKIDKNGFTTIKIGKELE